MDLHGLLEGLGDLLEPIGTCWYGSRNIKLWLVAVVLVIAASILVTVLVR